MVGNIGSKKLELKRFTEVGGYTTFKGTTRVKQVRMATTDDGDLSPSASEARDGQLKIDYVKALKNRLHGLSRQSQQDEVTFCQGLRDMLAALEEVQHDQTGAVLPETLQSLASQVNEALDKALQRLSEINPSLPSLERVVDLEGNPPKGQVPSANVSVGKDDTGGSGGASGFEMVAGTTHEDRESVAVPPR